jgi:hypothetical protein
MKNDDFSREDALAPGDLLAPILSLMEADGQAALKPLSDLLVRYDHDPRLYFMQGSLMASCRRLPLSEPMLAIMSDFCSD